MLASARLAVAVILSLGLLACGDDGFSPTVENMAGSYTATTFTRTVGGTTTDQLDLGAEVTVDLDEDGTMTGRIFLPEAEGAKAISMRASLEPGPSKVGRSPSSRKPTAFVREMQFIAGENQLSGEEDFRWHGPVGADQRRLALLCW